ncbi:MAG TPA: hypothetical protein VH309_09370, partial [Elusimicrobiota bacterium]|nr:hypothetical protein [Elusimicrobiota bacterium]
MKRALVPGVLLLAALCALPAAAAVSSLVLGSSVAFSVVAGGNNEAYGVVVDASNDVISVGQTGGNAAFLAKYNSSLGLVVQQTFNNMDGSQNQAQAVALRSSDGDFETVIKVDNDQAFAVALFDSNLNFLSSTTFPAAGNFTYSAEALAVDSAGNAYVAVQSFDSVSNITQFMTVKFSPTLALLASNTYSDSSNNDYAWGIAVDASNDVFVTGESRLGGGGIQFLTLRYDSGLTTVAHSATFGPGGTEYDRGTALVLKTNGVVVAGQTSLNGTSWSQTVVSYDSNLAFVSSGSFSSGAGDEDDVLSAALDSSGNVFVSGDLIPSGGSPQSASLTKFSSSLVATATAAFSNGSSDEDVANGVVTDSRNNALAVGQYNDGSDPPQALVMHFNGPPSITSISQGLQGASSALTLNGANFASGTSLSFTNVGITAPTAGLSENGNTQITGTVIVGGSVPLGNYGLIVTNPDGTTASANNIFQVIQQIAETAGSTFSGNAVGVDGPIVISGGAASFTQSATLTLSQPSPPAPGGFNPTGVSLEVESSPIGALGTTYTAQISYATIPSLTGLTPADFEIAYYDTGTSAWQALTSVVDTTGKTVTASVPQLGILEIMSGGGGGGGGGG